MALLATATALGDTTTPPTTTAGGSCDPELDVELLTTSQQQALASDHLLVKASSCVGVAETDMWARSRIADRGRRVTRKVHVRLRPANRIVSLPLTTRGTRRISRCRPQAISVRTFAVFEGDIILPGSDREDLELDRPACDG